MTRRIVLEIAAHSVYSAMAAVKGGADRIELCHALETGGVTPSYGLIKEICSRVSLPVHVLIRPRPGDFIFKNEEKAVMLRDIRLCKDLGIQGIVLGALKPDSSIDVDMTKSLMEASRPMSVTFHRAFDFTNDPFKALDVLCEIGVDRILTSGQKPEVSLGWPVIKKMVEMAGDRITILAGGGLTPKNAGEIIRKTGVSEVHSSAKSKVRSGMVLKHKTPVIGSTSLSETDHWESDVNLILEFRRLLEGLNQL